MMGFLPGCPIWATCRREFALPRRENPRTQVPRRLGRRRDRHDGRLPLESPGGWHILGRTPAPLWDLRRNPPAVLARRRQGAFAPMSLRRVRALLAQGGAGELRLEPDAPPSAAARMTAALRVVAPGLMTTLQDLGRPG